MKKQNKFFSVALTLMLVASAAATQAQYSLGSIDMTFVDSTRSNRIIEVEIAYPSDVTGYNVPVALPLEKKFPVIVFGHETMIPWNSYQYLWDFFVPRGFIIALVKTEMSATPDADAFSKDMSFVVNQFTKMRFTPGSLFFKKYNGKSCVMGHGMGGGAATLAAFINPTVTTLVTMAAEETVPSAINAAANIEIPALMFSGDLDCVTPAATNQDLIYNSLGSFCKAHVKLFQSTHCQFGQNYFTCTPNEVSCAPVTQPYFLTNILTNWLTVSWLRYHLKYNETAFPKFEWKLANKTSDWSYLYSCNATPRLGSGEEDEMDLDEYDSDLTLAALVYPNPVAKTGTVHIELAAPADQVKVNVIDMTGRVVRAATLIPDSDYYVKSDVDLQGISPGYYLINIISGGAALTKPLIIE